MRAQHIVVTGAANGLGAAIVSALDSISPFPFDVRRVHTVDREFDHDVRVPQGTEKAPACYSGPSLRAVPGLETCDVLINCAGINRIAWFEDVDTALWEETLSTNAMSIWRMTKHYLPALARAGGTVLNIVSNASHMPMRCSLAYNASKGAAHIMTLQMARELYDRHGITVFGISPNKLAGTEMSREIDEQVCATRGWTIEKAREYQLAGLATHEETDPATLAEFIAFLLSSKERHRYLHGCIIPYGA